LKEGVDRIALLGTSADPPTSGHEALLKGLLRIFPKVVTWASNNPMKTHGASLQTRYTLLSALVKEINNPNLLLMQEISSPLTITTLERAKKYWPKTELFFVVGSDLAAHIPNWSQPKEFLRKARLAIAPRTGWPISQSQLEALHALGGEVEILPLKIPATASSQIRNNPSTSHIPASILPILIELNLYGLNKHHS